MTCLNDFFFSLAVCGQMAARETTGEATCLRGLHRRSRVFISGGNRKKMNLKLFCIETCQSSREFALMETRFNHSTNIGTRCGSWKTETRFYVHEDQRAR